MTEEKKIKVKLKKKEEEVKEEPAVPTRDKEIFDLLSKIGKTIGKIENLKGVEIEIEEMVLEGVMPPYELLTKILSGASTPVVVPTEVPPPPPPKLEEFKFIPPIETYRGEFGEVKIGATKEEGGTRAFTLFVGRNTAPTYYKFEGDLPYRPVIAHCIFDEYFKLPKALKEYYGDVIGDPVNWAKKCVEVYGAKMIWLDLNSTDPKGTNRSAEEAVRTVKEVMEAVSVPIGICVRSGNMKRDVEVLKKCAEVAKGENILMFNRSITLPAWMGAGESVAKEITEYFEIAKENGHIATCFQAMNLPGLAMLNRSASEAGLTKDKIITDPGMAPLGYGTEVSITAMDGICAKALAGEENYQAPIISSTADAWTVKEAFMEDEKMGPVEKRGPAMEIGLAMASLMSGTHLLVMLDQYAIDTVERFLDRIYEERIKTSKDLKKFLPQNDCKNCGYESCLDFAYRVMKGEENVEKCERLTESGIRGIKKLLSPVEKEITTESEEIYDWIKQI